MVYALQGPVLTDLQGQPGKLATGEAEWLDAWKMITRHADSQAESHWLNFVPYSYDPPHLAPAAKNARYAFESDEMNLVGNNSKLQTAVLERLDFGANDRLDPQKLAGPTILRVLTGRFYIDAIGSMATVLQAGDYLALPEGQGVQISEDAGQSGQLLRFTIVPAQQ
jgi:hypothetical protein